MSVSPAAGTPLGDQLPAVPMAVLEAPVHVLVAPWDAAITARIRKPVLANENLKVLNKAVFIGISSEFGVRKGEKRSLEDRKTSPRRTLKRAFWPKIATSLLLSMTAKLLEVNFFLSEIQAN